MAYEEPVLFLLVTRRSSRGLPNRYLTPGGHFCVCRRKHVILSQFRYLRCSTWCAWFIAPTSHHSITPPHSKRVTMGFSFTLPVYPSIGTDAFFIRPLAKVICYQHYHSSDALKQSPGLFLSPYMRLRTTLGPSSRLSLRVVSFPVITGPIWPTNMVCATFMHRADQGPSPSVPIGGQLSPLGRSTAFSDKCLA
ncbi:hypothetical protein BGY98DRAFT_183830 [Russula aff. rugulosa BPL654]|nr:hypothetical protein BGY98DRAFT_183830 [Russula aff. rugulosa BPL654]